VRRAFRIIVIGLAAASVVLACDGSQSSPSAVPTQAPSGGASGTLIVYSGRSEELIGPLVERFRVATGVEVKVNYAGSTDLAATILEEGAASPADVFFSQDAGALGAVAAGGYLAALPEATLGAVDARFASTDGLWVGTSGRARVVAYDSRSLSEADLPSTIDGFTDPAWTGRIAWAPTNASFQSFVTAYRVLRGDDAARSWLEGVLATDPKVYDGNDAIIAAIAAGEAEVGFVNHYYALQQAAEQGADFPVHDHFLAGGDPGSLVNVAGVGILATSKNPAAAQAFVDFLLSTDGQTFFATETFEYPLVAGVPGPDGVPALARIESPAIDLSQLADLEGTLRLLQEAGVL
jgi:iron(III) transport system substrate-binding protein